MLNDLAKAGLAVRRRRHGTFVADGVRQVNLLNFVVLFSVAPDLLYEDLDHLVSLAYLRRREVPVDTIRLYLDPVSLDEADAALLDSEPGTATMRRRRELRVTDGTVVEVVTALVRPGTAEFFVELPASAV